MICVWLVRSGSHLLHITALRAYNEIAQQLDREVGSLRSGFSANDLVSDDLRFGEMKLSIEELNVHLNMSQGCASRMAGLMLGESGIFPTSFLQGSAPVRRGGGQGNEE